MAKKPQTVGAVMKKEASDSIQIDALPSNKTMYVARLNNEDDPEVDPKRCQNIGEVFDTFKPEVETTVESLEGETFNAKFQFKKIEDFSPKKVIEQNEALSEMNLEKELLNDMVKQIDKNVALKKGLKDPKKREEFLKLIDSCINLLGS
jgi:type VI secretion system ImpB/VipA family protein